MILFRGKQTIKDETFFFFLLPPTYLLPSGWTLELIRRAPSSQLENFSDGLGTKTKVPLLV